MAAGPQDKNVVHDLCNIRSTHFDSSCARLFSWTSHSLVIPFIRSILGQMFEAPLWSCPSVDPAGCPKMSKIHWQSLLVLACSSPYLWGNQVPALSPVCTYLVFRDPVHSWFWPCLKWTCVRLTAKPVLYGLHSQLQSIPILKQFLLTLMTTPAHGSSCPSSPQQNPASSVSIPVFANDLLAHSWT